VENVTQVIPPKMKRGHGFFASKHTDSGASAVEATVENIDSLVTSSTGITLGFVGWVKGMGGVFDSIYARADALQKAEEAEAKKVAELLKLAIIVTKDISSFFKDLRQWHRFVNGALKQWKKGYKNQLLTKDAKKALDELQRIRKEVCGSGKKKLQLVLKWGIRNNAKVLETCERMIGAFADEELPLDEDDEDDSVDDGAGGGEDADDGRDFMSNMKSYCFRKFGKVAEGKLNKHAKVYDKVQIHLLCEYGECHVPEGMLNSSNCPF
jgi:hypothetical protein